MGKRKPCATAHHWVLAELVHHDDVERINYHRAQCKKCHAKTILPSKEFAVSWQLEEHRGA